MGDIMENIIGNTIGNTMVDIIGDIVVNSMENIMGNIMGEIMGSLLMKSGFLIVCIPVRGCFCNAFCFDRILRVEHIHGLS